MKRLFKEPYTFKNGLHVNPNTYVCMPVFAIENDPELVPNPTKFDGLRHYRLATTVKMSASRKGDGESARAVHDFSFSTPSPTALSFGYGKAACPGRFFASLIIKMVFVKLLSEYDFQFVPKSDGRPGRRPSNYMVHEFLFPWPWDWMHVKRREGSHCPF